MNDPLTLPDRASYTQIATFQRCRFRYYLKYIKGVQTRGKGMGLLKGTLLHEAYDKYLFNGRQSHQDAYARLHEVAAQEVERGVDPSSADQAVSEASAVLAHYLPWADENDKFQVVIPAGQQQCETSGTLPIKLPDGTFKDLFFKIDTLISQDGQLGMMEHKFRKNLDSSGLEHDLQILIYQAAWNVLHPEHKLSYVLYNIVGTTPRKKDGAIAVRQLYYRGEAEQRRGLSNVASVLYQMKRAISDPLQIWPLTPSKDCNWDCDFVGMCLGIRAGASLNEYLGNGTYFVKGDRPSAAEPQPTSFDIVD